MACAPKGVTPLDCLTNEKQQCMTIKLFNLCNVDGGVPLSMKLSYCLAPTITLLFGHFFVVIGQC